MPGLEESKTKKDNIKKGRQVSKHDIKFYNLTWQKVHSRFIQKQQHISQCVSGSLSDW